MEKKQKNYTLPLIIEICSRSTTKTRKKDVNSSKNSIRNNKQLIQYFKDKNHESKKKKKKFEAITTTINTFDTFAIIATTSSSFTLSLTGIGLKAMPKSTPTACGFSTGN